MTDNGILAGKYSGKSNRTSGTTGQSVRMQLTMPLDLDGLWDLFVNLLQSIVLLTLSLSLHAMIPLTNLRRSYSVLCVTVTDPSTPVWREPSSQNLP